MKEDNSNTDSGKPKIDERIRELELRVEELEYGKEELTCTHSFGPNISRSYNPYKNNVGYWE